MADEVRRAETVDERPRDTVVVKEGKSNVGWIILGVIVVLLLIFWFIGNPFTADDTDSTDVNVPNEVNVDIPSPDVDVPDVNINEAPTTPDSTQPAQ